MLDPHMESTKLTSMYVELGKHLSTDVGHGGKCQPTEIGAKWARWGCSCTKGAAAPWLSPNAPIFSGSPLVSIVTWPMVVLCEVEVICFGYGLVLLILGPLVLHISRPSLLVTFVSLVFDGAQMRRREPPFIGREEGLTMEYA